MDQEKFQFYIKKNDKTINCSLLFYKVFSFILLILLFILIFSISNNISYVENFIKQNFEYTSNSHNQNISEKIKLLKYMTNNNPLKYKGAENCLLNGNESQLCIYNFVSPKKALGKKRILLGKRRDGSYVLLDDFEKVKIAYSFGISNNVDFDLDLANRGIDIFMYDHTINNLPLNNSRFHWEKIGLSGKQNKNESMKTIEELLEINGHISEENMILKMDIENSEWMALSDLSDSILKKFKYIVMEFHFSGNMTNERQKLFYEVLKKLHKNHQPFYFRCNFRQYIISFGNNRICGLLEISYVIRKDNYFIKDDSVYPIFEFDHETPNLQNNEFDVNIFTLFD